MAVIDLTTIISAPIGQVFDLSRDIGVHLLSTGQTHEKVIAGRRSGLIGKGETVTWKARHFGIYLTHKSVISQMEFPVYFVDEMEEGQFRSFVHEHRFESQDGFTTMTDCIRYETPLGILGKLFDLLILKRYMAGFIGKRNLEIKRLAEEKH